MITSNEGTGSEIGMGNGGIKMEFEMCLWIARNFAVKEIRVYSGGKVLHYGLPHENRVISFKLCL